MSLSTATAGTPVAAKNPAPVEVDWKANTIAPVTNPIFFEDPVIRSEIRPIFIYHTLDNNFLTGGGHATLYALQIRYALTDRLLSSRRRTATLTSTPPVSMSMAGWIWPPASNTR